VDAAGQHVHAPGNYGLVVGSASPGARAVALGAPAPATGTVALV
jgi:beta-glucosidase